MNYLISKFDCFMVGSKYQQVFADVLYEIDDINNYALVFGKDKEIPFYINFCETENNNYTLIEHGNNKYFLLTGEKFCAPASFVIKHLGKSFYITLSNQLVIFCENDLILKKRVENIKFSHFEVVNNILILYFEGKRNFAVIINKTKIEIANYYDEFNIKSNTRLFMTKLFDTLNHGRVYKVDDNNILTYLVYLDDNDLNLKTEFIGCVFLDCLFAKNYKYCNNLLDDSIKQKDAEDISRFFPKFNYYFPIKDNCFVLINKNALAGICEFSINNNLITNIIL